LETVQRSGKVSWMQTTALIRAKAQDDYSRMLTFDKRIRYIHGYLYARAWYLAQIFTPKMNASDN
jgi:hypothetical protein